MTQPDKWDEIAEKMAVRWYERGGTEYLVDEDDIAQALRDAEKAGMERAVKVAEKLESALWRTYRKNHEPHTEGMSDGAGKVVGAIRATMETKE
jgi:hypothetical protein